MADSHPSADMAAALEALKTRLGPKGWSQDPARVEPKLQDWRGRWRGETPLLILPKTTEETADAVKICAQAGLSLTPQGGNTGLVGGGLPYGSVLLSLERMTEVRALDPLNDSVTVEAGVILETLHEAVAAQDRLFPLSLGAKGSATIGGLISTNAGGTAVLRYGMMRDLVLGLEVVLPDGRIWNGLRGLRKDNTGYDLKQLFIGAEGTLGVITAAVLKLFPRPKDTATAFVAVNSPQAAVALFARMKTASGGLLSGFELMPRLGVELTVRHISGTRDPLSTPYPWYVLIEIDAGQPGQAQAMMEAGLGDAFDAGLALDGAVAGNAGQAQDFWRLRESLPEAEKLEGPAVKHDVSAPISVMPQLINDAWAAAQAVYPEARLIAFGHVGDGNVHFNVAAPPGAERTALAPHANAITEAVHDVVARLNGSISAEHGIGVMKRDELASRKAGPDLDVMTAVKTALDPRGVMNPGVMLARRSNAD